MKYLTTLSRKPAAAFILSLFLVACGSSGGSDPGGGGTDLVPFCETDAECQAGSTNECTIASCDLVDGVCINTPLAEGSPCDDGAGVCRDGFCAATELKAFVKSPNPEPNALFGTSVSILGDRMVVGAPSSGSLSGKAAVFERTDDQWAVAQQINTPPLGQSCGDGLFGWSVASSDKSVLVGAMGFGLGGSGSVRVFVQRGDEWLQESAGVQRGCLVGSDTTSLDLFGASISLTPSGETLVVGAPGHSTVPIPFDERDYSGAAYIFEKINPVDWEQAPILTASNAGGSYQCGPCDDVGCVTTGEGDGFGASVAVWDDTVVVGAPGEGSAATGVNGNEGDNSTPAAGAAYVFQRIDGVWEQTAYLKASNTDEGDRFGFAVAIRGDTIVVGAEREDSGDTANQGDNSAPEAGAAYVFERVGGVWEQTQYLKASNVQAGYFFGANLALTDTTLVVGSPGESSIGGEDSGAAYVFSLVEGEWTQSNFYKAFNADAGSAFAGPPGSVTYRAPDIINPCASQATNKGSSLSLDGDTLVVGTPYEDSAAVGVNGVPTGNSIPNSGAVYIFDNSEGQ